MSLSLEADRFGFGQLREILAAAIRRPMEGLSMFANLEGGWPRIVQKRGMRRGTMREKLRLLHEAGKVGDVDLMEIDM